MTISNHVYRGVEGRVTKTPDTLPSELGPKEVLLRITHASLCGTDLHIVHLGIALGHEGVGIVEKTGSDVTQLKVGDRAGACGSCQYCLKGEETYCYLREGYAENGFNKGTFGDYYIGIETYLHKIPDSMASEHAAPLQCAGSTVYTALVSSIKPGDRVGVIGIGGLGHLAIQFSSKFGAETIAFSTSPSKEAEARSFGASEFYLLSEPEKIKRPLNVLIIAGNGYPDWAKSWPVFFDGYQLKSTIVGSRAVHKDMLAFAAHHNIKPTIEKFELSEEGLTQAVDKMQNGSLRYRAVLVRSEEA
ncbi:alcohol dehydrogenase [Lachnellula suecica]|uniref:Alcohol dehydrogenase n=1 Tax=Lachnellula suecica TaxID=602035 RepID=A0A8T9C0D5_9HELO|nr:alcohol dehydrogenase [Lachnellula suecica]